MTTLQTRERAVPCRRCGFDETPRGVVARKMTLNNSGFCDECEPSLTTEVRRLFRVLHLLKPRLDRQ